MIRKILFLLPMLALAAPAFADSQGSATGGTRATQSTLSGCTYNAVAPTLTSGQQVGLQCDVNGKVAISGSITATNPSVGTNAATAPTSSTQIGSVDGSGNLQPASSTNPIPVSSATLPLPSGAATSALQTTGNASLATIATNSGLPVPACSGSPCTTIIGAVTNDPCGYLSKSGAPISLTASGQLITGTAAKKTYICSIDLVSATAQNIALVEGTGSTCATNIFGLAGGTTAATGWNLAANGGLTKGSGVGTVYSPSADTNATAANVCLLLSSTGQTSGQITYVQQ
jgi:hypothetical protein